MKVIRKINNNVALGKDSQGREIIVFGKGIGFPPMPYEISDLEKIDRTFYDIDRKYYGLLKEIPDTIFLLVSRLLDSAKNHIEGRLNPNLVFVLADHIHFASERLRKGMDLQLPYSYELEYEYPELTKVAAWMVRQINDKLKISMDKGEITSITMHLLNALEGEEKDSVRAEHFSENIGKSRIAKIITEITKIVEGFFGICLDKKSYHYFRFKNHLKFFVQRKERGEEFADINNELYQSVKKSQPEVFACVQRVDDYLLWEFGERCPEEELLYLMIHISQLYNKDNCSRKGLTPK